MIDLIINRRSIRKYLKKDIDDSIIKQIINCGRNAPFGGKPVPTCQVTEYIVIKEKEIKDKLALNYEDRQFIKNAPVIIAILANKENDPKYKEYILSSALAMENMIIGAHSLGLGTCILSCFINHEKHEEDKNILRDVLKLPNNIELVALLTLGYKDESETIIEKELREYNDVVNYNTYSIKSKK